MPEPNLRREFVAEIRRDPYAAMITSLYGDAWAKGYYQALRDALYVLQDHPDADAKVRELLYEDSHSDRCERAIEWATNERRRSEAQLLVALAAVGPTLQKPPPGVA